MARPPCDASSMAKTKAEQMSEPLTQASLSHAVFYMLQLSVEWQINGGAREKGGKTLSNVVNELEWHRKKRMSRLVLVNLVNSHQSLLPLVARGKLPGSLEAGKHWAELWRILVVAGVSIDREEEAKEIFKETVTIREDYRPKIRSKGDILCYKLAKIADDSQSEFIKRLELVRADHGKIQVGDLSTRHHVEYAALDREPDALVLLAYVLRVLGMDEESSRSLLHSVADSRGVRWFLENELIAAEKEGLGKKVIAEATANKIRGLTAVAQAPSAARTSIPSWLEDAFPIETRDPDVPRPVPRLESPARKVRAADIPTLSLWASAGDARSVRARTIQLLAEGRFVKYVAAELDVGVTTVFAWWDAYASGGLEALEGAPPHEPDGGTTEESRT